MSADLDICDRDQLPLILRVDEAASLLRVSKRAVYAMLRRDQLPGARKAGGTWLLHRDTILDWIAGGAE